MTTELFQAGLDRPILATAHFIADEFGHISSQELLSHVTIPSGPWSTTRETRATTTATGQDPEIPEQLLARYAAANPISNQLTH